MIENRLDFGSRLLQGITDEMIHEAFGLHDDPAGIEGGKTFWSTFFSTPEVDVQIGIRANRSSVGYYLIIFEDKAGRCEFDAEKKVREKKAL